MQLGKTIDFCLRYYDNIAAAVEEAREDPNTPKVGGGGHCRISDPTAMLAIRRTEEVPCVRVFYGASVSGKQDFETIYRPESWLRVIDNTRRHFAGSVQWDLVLLKYKDGLTRDDILSCVKVGRTNYYVMLDGVFCYATGAAEMIGLGGGKVRA